MRYLKPLCIISILICSFTIKLSAQNRYFSKANTMYEVGRYSEAIDLLKEAYERVDDRERRTEIIFKIADCFRHIDDPEHAELWFKKAIDRDYQNPLVYLYYAQALQMNQKYKDAAEAFRKYKDLVPDDVRGENGLQACAMAPKWLENPNGYQVENMKFLNTRDIDYCPAYGRNDYMVVYFTSARPLASNAGKIILTGNGNPVYIYVSKQDKKDKWSEPVQLGEEINSEAEVGCPNLNTTFTTMYYGVCKHIKNKKDVCQIYFSKLNGESFTKGEPLKIVPDSIVVSHPAISPDELTLYFTSDMPGGLGGKDIWKVTRESVDADWGKPENLGSEINTPGDEMFPYVHPDGTLYFSSNGWPGLGGLDIFKAKKQEDGHWKVENMRYPINSAGDDFGIVFQAGAEKGLFSSSRNGRDDDIFSFVLPPLKFELAGVVKEDHSEKVLPETKVKIIGSDGITSETTTGKDGSFKFSMKPNTDYVFIAMHAGYLNGKQRETTKGEDKSKNFKTTILLTSIAKPIELPNIYYDFAKADLRPESMIALDKLVETLNDNPNITIELMANTDYIGNDATNLELSQKRAQSVVNYLIEKGIAADRLTAKGYGETKPKEVDDKINAEYSFLPVGTVLTESFIKTLTSDQQEFANQINRRTEFRVLRTDYVSKK